MRIYNISHPGVGKVFKSGASFTFVIPPIGDFVEVGDEYRLLVNRAIDKTEGKLSTVPPGTIKVNATFGEMQSQIAQMQAEIEKLRREKEILAQEKAEAKLAQNDTVEVTEKAEKKTEPTQPASSKTKKEKEVEQNG